MPIFMLYMSRLFAARFAVILAGLALLILLLDVMAESSDIIAGADGAAGLWRYGWLRLPLIVSRLIPFSVLIAALLTLISLSRHHELVVMAGAGVSQLKLIATFLPLAAVIAGAHFWIDDRVAPVSMTALDAWEAAGYSSARPAAGGGEVMWVRAGNDIIRLRRDGLGDERLGAAAVVHRSATENRVVADRLAARAGADQDQEGKQCEGRMLFHR